MKKRLLMFALLMPLWTFAAERAVRLSVPAMNCPTCPLVIKKVLQGIDGVEVRSVDLKRRTVDVFVANDAVTDARLMQATELAGYPSSVIARE